MINLRDNRLHILIASMLLTIVGLMFIYSAGSLQALRIGRGEFFFFMKQMIAIVLGFIALYTAYNIPLSFYRKNVMIIFLATLILLTLVFFMPTINGAKRWIVLPLISFQPSELAKFTAVLYLAHYLDKKTDKIVEFASGFLPATLLVGLLASLIILEPDFGTTFIIVVVSTAMFMVGGARIIHILGIAGIVLPILTSALLFGYRKGRIMSFLDPWGDRFGAGYQLIQSLAAVGSGGVIGKGIGNSTQKLYFLPEAHTDFIFAIIAEEIGMIGSVSIFLIILFFFIATMRVAFNCKDNFAKLLVFGISLMIFVQSFIHIFVVLGLMPTKGITLPFVSYGGSAMIFTLFFVGVILRASEENR